MARQKQRDAKAATSVSPVVDALSNEPPRPRRPLPPEIRELIIEQLAAALESAWRRAHEPQALEPEESHRALEERDRVEDAVDDARGRRRA